MDIDGQLVRLRAFRDDDNARMVEMLADARVSRFLDHWARAPYSAASARTFITAAPESTTRTWAVEARADGTLVGSTGLHDIDFQNRHCSWGIWLAPPERWGQGLGTEACMLAVDHAFRALGLQKVQLQVYAGNDRGRRTYEKAGFTSEGTLRRQYMLDGRLVDVDMMAVFADNPLYSDPIATTDPR